MYMLQNFVSYTVFKFSVCSVVHINLCCNITDCGMNSGYDFWFN